jgi:hypothetical protein
MKEMFNTDINNIRINEQKENLLSLLKKDTREYSGEVYERIYAPIRKYWGISSPAFIIPKRSFSNISDPGLIPENIQGDFAIIINKDCANDPDFVRYITEHEHQELYIFQKEGFNLKDITNYDNRLPLLERNRPAHRFATYQEFKMAEHEGKLDEYMEWWRTFYENDMELIENMEQTELEKILSNYNTGKDGRESILMLIRNNMNLKEEIYNKIIANRKNPVIDRRAA